MRTHKHTEETYLFLETFCDIRRPDRATVLLVRTVIHCFSSPSKRIVMKNCHEKMATLHKLKTEKKVEYPWAILNLAYHINLPQN